MLDGDVAEAIRFVGAESNEVVIVEEPRSGVELTGARDDGVVGVEDVVGDVDDKTTNVVDVAALEGDDDTLSVGVDEGVSLDDVATGSVEDGFAGIVDDGIVTGVDDAAGRGLVDDADELATWAEEKFAKSTPNARTSTPPPMPTRSML